MAGIEIRCLWAAIPAGRDPDGWPAGCACRDPASLVGRRGWPPVRTGRGGQGWFPAAWRRPVTALIRSPRAARRLRPRTRSAAMSGWYGDRPRASLRRAGSWPSPLPDDTMSVSCAQREGVSSVNGAGRRPPSGSGTSRIRRQRRPEHGLMIGKDFSGHTVPRCARLRPGAASISSMSGGISGAAVGDGHAAVFPTGVWR